jgi:hypothetical protein
MCMLNKVTSSIVGEYLLGEDLYRTLYHITQEATKLTETRGFKNIGQTMLEQLDRYDDHPCEVDEESTVANMRSYMKLCGLKGSGNKADIWEIISEFQRDIIEVNGIPLSDEFMGKYNAVKDKMVYAKTAKEKYGLTKKDLDILSYTVVKNPYCSTSVSSIYSVNDIIKRSKERFGDLKGLEKRFDQKRKRGEVIKRKKREKEVKEDIKKEERGEELRFLFKKRNLSYRSNSRLCDQFIENNIGDPDRIVDIMEEMDFYYNKTCYQEEYSDIVKGYREYGDRYDRDEVSEMAKGYALRKFIDKYPSVQECLKEDMPQTIEDYIIAYV